MQRYIDLGWHTVPLTGELKRLEDGTKTIPHFEENWRDKYSEEFNTRATRIGGAITGEKSDIIAIDCDNSATWELFRSLDPEYGFTFYSVGKGSEVCGTLIYKYTPEIPTGFNVRNNLLSLDVYSNRGFIYLATEHNHTKLEPSEWNVKPVPHAILVLLKQLQMQQDSKVQRVVVDKPIYTSYLAPLLAQFAQSKKFMPGLFKIITPLDFRELEAYQRQGYIHPEDIPSGRGSEYLSKVSAILGADRSVDKELYVNAMNAINSLFADPMPIRRLDSTILDPMVEEKSSINGTPIWQYDEHWEKQRVIVQTKRQTAVELAYDDHRMQYYAIDVSNEDVKNFNKDTDLFQYIEAIGVNPPKKADAKRAMPLIEVSCNPSLPFGYYDEDNYIRRFNNFIPTPGLRVLHNPEAFADKYKRPDYILNFFESLIPDDEMRGYLLRFIKTKFKYFKYSPVILYFLGVHGSGKDTFVSLMEAIISKVARPTVKEFLEPFNGYMLDNYFVQLDEYGNQLQRASDKDEALGKLKAYSGKERISIRVMRTDGYDYNHFVTFISTANKNPLVLEDGDRRLAVFKTPNPLVSQDWVVKAGGVAKVYDKMMSEVVDFCYYLATEVEDCIGNEYVSPPETEDKHLLIANSMGIATRLAYACKHDQAEMIRDLAIEVGCKSAVDELDQFFITTSSLQEIYDEHTNFEGDKRAMVKALKQLGVNTKRTTNRHNQHTFKVEFTRTAVFTEEEGAFGNEELS